MPLSERSSLETGVSIGRPVRFTKRYRLLAGLKPVVIALVLCALFGMGAGVLFESAIGAQSFPALTGNPDSDINSLESYFHYQKLVGAVFVVLTVWILVLYVAGAVFCTPTILRNPTIASWFRERREEGISAGVACFVVQLTLRPRLFRGFVGWFEDADDVGLLTLHDDGLAYEGDAIALTVAWTDIESMKTRRAGRVFWVYGPDLVFSLAEPLNGIAGFMLRIREGRTILHTRERSRELLGLIEARLDSGAPTADSVE